MKSIHYAWYVAIGCCLLFSYGVGLTTGTFAIFMSPLTKELNLTNAQVSSIFSVISIIGLCFMVIFDKLSLKIGIRKIIFIGGILIALGNYVFSISKSLLHCYLAAILIGTGYGCCTTITIAILLNRWFTKSRGLAMGIAFSGSGIAIITFSPLLSNIITYYGVNAGFITQCIIIFILSLICYLLIRDYPKDKNLSSYGCTSDNNVTNYEKSIFISSKLDKKILFSKKFMILIIVALLLGVTVQPMVSHITSFLIFVGYDDAIAMSITSIYGFSMIVWKSCYGFFIDKLGSNKTNFIFFPLWMLILMISYIVKKSIILTYIFLLMIGIGPAIATVSIPIWVTDMFQEGPINQITTIMQITTIGASSFGMALIGYLVDLTGSYNVAISILIIISLIAFICITALYSNYFEGERSGSHGI